MERIVHRDPPIVNPLSGEEMAKHDHGDDLDELLQVNGFTLQVNGVYTAPVFEPVYIPINAQKKNPDLYFNTEVTLSDIKLTLQRSRWRVLIDAVLWPNGPRQTLTLTNEELRDLLFNSLLPVSTPSQLSPAAHAELMEILDEQEEANLAQLCRMIKESTEAYRRFEAEEAERRRRGEIDDIFDEEGCDD